LPRKIVKKILPIWFEKVASGEKQVEIRLADFDISEGDFLILREWDPIEQKFTGRELVKKVKRVHRVPIAEYYDVEKIKKYGIYLIEFT